jgi:hypothetical protein
MDAMVDDDAAHNMSITVKMVRGRKQKGAKRKERSRTAQNSERVTVQYCHKPISI